MFVGLPTTKIGARDQDWKIVVCGTVGDQQEEKVEEKIEDDWRIFRWGW